MNMNLNALMKETLDNLRRLHPLIQRAVEAQTVETDLIQSILLTVADAGNCLSLAIEDAEVDRVASQILQSHHEQALHRIEELELRIQPNKDMPADSAAEESVEGAPQ